MADHRKALVPIDTWCYGSPDVKVAGRGVDVGLLAEALLYYDQVLVSTANAEQFAELLKWFVMQNKLADFIALVNDGSLAVFDFAFMTSAVLGPEGYSLWNIQDERQAAPNTFAARYLYHRSVQDAVPRSRDREKLYRAFDGHVVEVKSEDFAPAVENARADLSNHRRNAIILQAFVDDLWRIRGLGRPPEIVATVAERPEVGHQITWNIDFGDLERIARKELEFHPGMPFAAGAICNRQLFAASREGCDLFLSSPMSVLTGDKLYETVRGPARVGEILDELHAAVDFPDVRGLVNNEQLGLDEVLALRSKADRFREWLQLEADRDRDAIIAYHNEVGRVSGFSHSARKVLHLFSVPGGGALGSMVGSAVAGEAGLALGGAAGATTSYLIDLATKIERDWRPVVFGNWIRTRIESVLDESVSDRPRDLDRP